MKQITITRITYFFDKQKEGTRKEGTQWIKTNIVHFDVPENKLIQFQKEMAKLNGASNCLCDYVFKEKLPMFKDKSDPPFIGYAFFDKGEKIVLINYTSDSEKLLSKEVLKSDLVPYE